jgi:hypothetical protein
MQSALKPYATAGIAITGASLIAITPVTPRLPDLSYLQSAAVHLTAGESLGDVFNAAAANAQALINSYFVAPNVGAQAEDVVLNGIFKQSLTDPDFNTQLALEDNFKTIISAITLQDLSAKSSSGDGTGTGTGDGTGTGSGDGTGTGTGTGSGSGDAGGDGSGSGDAAAAASSYDFDAIKAAVIPHTLGGPQDLTTLGEGHITLGHALLASQLPGFLPPDIDPDTIAPILNFLESPLSGVIIGALGPFISPLVALSNDMSSGDMGNVFTDVLNGFLNGATLNLDSVIPTIEDAGILPDGITINSLEFAFGGLLTPGVVDAGPYEYYNSDGDVVAEAPANGGSIFNALGLNITTETPPLGLPGPLTIDVVGEPVGPVGAWEGLSQALAAALVGFPEDFDNDTKTDPPPVPPLVDFDLSDINFNDIFGDMGGDMGM